MSVSPHHPAAQVLGLLGVPVQPILQAMEGRRQPLNRMISTAERSADGMTLRRAHGLASEGNLPGAGIVQPPPPLGGIGAANYAPPRLFNFTPSASTGLDPASMQMRKRALGLGNFLQGSPFERQQLEMTMGGRILPDGVQKGVLQVEPFQTAHPTAVAPGAPAALTPAMSSVGGLQRGASMFGPDPFGEGVYQQMMLGALANTLTDTGPQGMNPGAPADQNQGATGAGLTTRGAGLNPGAPAGTQNPGANRRRSFALEPLFPEPRLPAPNGINPGAGQAPGGGAGLNPGAGQAPGGGGGLNPGFGFGNPLGNMLGGAMGPQIGGILGAPGMTVEDQVVMLLMQISKRFDQQIQQQAQAVNQMQQQQGGQNGNAGGSIDVATMKLKRLIDKRGQMFDMLRQLIDKYNETAKNIIGMVGR